MINYWVELYDIVVNFKNLLGVSGWWKWKESEVAQSCLTLCDPMDSSPPGSSVHGIFQAWILEWVAISFSRGSSWPRDWTRVSCIVGRCFTVWATREGPQFVNELYSIGLKESSVQFSSVAQSCSTLCDPMDSIVSPWNSPGQNTGVGSLSLLQVIFPTQGSNPGLPPCRQILYQLSHKGSPLATWCGKTKQNKRLKEANVSRMRSICQRSPFVQT